MLFQRKQKSRDTIKFILSNYYLPDEEYPAITDVRTPINSIADVVALFSDE